MHGNNSSHACFQSIPWYYTVRIVRSMNACTIHAINKLFMHEIKCKLCMIKNENHAWNCLEKPQISYTSYMIKIIHKTSCRKIVYA